MICLYQISRIGRIGQIHFQKYTCFRYKHRMNKEVYFRHFDNSDRFEVTFKICRENLNRQFNFKRLLSENIDSFLNRIRANVDKVFNRKVKRKKRSETLDEKGTYTEALDVKLIKNGSIVDGSKPCKEVIFNGDTGIFLHILGDEYKVIVNPPWVDSLCLPQNLMVGSYCYPSKLEISFGNQESSIFEWFKCNRNSSSWTEVDCPNQLLYLSEDYLNCKLKLRCIPGNGQIFGPELEVLTNAVVKESPANSPFLKRHKFTNHLLPNGRVVSYNILADIYAESATAKQELFPYCPPFALNIDYRKQLYLKEILGYNADIISLQEVDVRIFKNDLCPVLEKSGYEGVLTRKSGTVAEGIATFFSKRKFRLVDMKELSFSNEIDSNPIFIKIWNAIKNNEAVVNNFKQRTTVFHALVLESGTNTIVVGNTHLYFFPSADHIRLLQGGMATLYLEDIVKNLQKMGKKITLLFCGDMNSTPDCGLYSLMTKKIAPAHLPDWHSDKTEVVQGFDMVQPFEMKSAYGEPKFTNYTAGFSGCLDYIYYQSDMLNLLQAVPLPSDEEVKAHTALPSPLFPSDHVALVADFEWINS